MAAFVISLFSSSSGASPPSSFYGGTRHTGSASRVVEQHQVVSADEPPEHLLQEEVEALRQRTDALRNGRRARAKILDKLQTDLKQERAELLAFDRASDASHEALLGILGHIAQQMNHLEQETGQFATTVLAGPRTTERVQILQKRLTRLQVEITEATAGRILDERCGISTNTTSKKGSSPRSKTNSPKHP
ncbi:unnamed protein product, partial [Amoebophrya sp. A25]|eukprot:GSA25T00021136001.1